jgi:hypothetical protein
MKILLVMLLCVVSVFPARTHAQLAVIDVANLKQNTVTAFQSTLTTLEAIFHSTQWVLELTSYDSGSLGPSFDADLNELSGILGETQAILWEAKGIIADMDRLFGPGDAPDASQGIRERLQEAQFWQWERKRKVQEVQSLPGRIGHTVERIKGLWGRIFSVAGAKQTGQQLQQMLQQMQYLESQSQVVVASYQQIMLTETMEQPWIDEANRRINDQVYSTMPRR